MLDDVDATENKIDDSYLFRTMPFLNTQPYFPGTFVSVKPLSEMVSWENSVSFILLYLLIS